MLSFGNKKLPGTTAIWSLPCQITCPNKTKWCTRWCYSQKAERLYKNTVKSRTRNLEYSKLDYFTGMMSGEIIQNIKKISAIRIHASGDFYNQKYLDKWIEIMNNFPRLLFTTYTKSILDYSKLPSNCVLFFSVDESTRPSDLKWYLAQGKRMAYADTEVPENAIICPAKTTGCGECKVCYSKSKKSVWFKRH